MARILFLAFSGGGNLPPSLGIARVLRERGHETIFAGDPEMIPRMKPTPHRALAFTEAYTQSEFYKASPFADTICFLSSPAVEAQAAAIIESENPDFILVDFLFFAAGLAAWRSKRPMAVMVHMAFDRVLDPFRGLAEGISAIHREAGFSPLPTLDELTFSRAPVIVTSLRPS